VIIAQGTDVRPRTSAPERQLEMRGNGISTPQRHRAMYSKDG